MEKEHHTLCTINLPWLYRWCKFCVNICYSPVVHRVFLQCWKIRKGPGKRQKSLSGSRTRKCEI